MSVREQYIDSMVNDYETTTNTDFRKYDITPVMKTVYQSKPPRKKREKSPVKYTHTMSDWKNVPVPLSLMVELKEIVRTNPHQIQKAGKMPDLEKDKVRRTRPRLVMTPAVSIDDVDDETKRKLLVDDKYTTHMMKEFGSNYKSLSLTAPLRGRYARPKPITLAQYTSPYVSPEWRMASASWDRHQRRSFCDATKTFWLNRSK